MEEEPRVVTEDVRAILTRVLSQFDDDDGESVAMLAQRADTSTRTVYRVLGVASSSIKLELADRLLVAAGGHLSDVRLVWPDGRIENG